MLNEHVSFFRKVLLGIDLAVITGAFFLSYYLSHDLRSLYPLDYYLWILPVVLLLWIGLFTLFGMYVSFRLKRAGEILWIILESAVLGFLIFGALYFVFKITYLSRSFIMILFGVTAVLLVLDKMFIMLFFKRLRKLGFTYRNILVVGTGARAQYFMRKVNATPEFGLRIVGLVDEDPARLDREYEGHRVIGTLADWPQLMKNHALDHVFFFVPREWLKRIEGPMQFCEMLGIPVSVAMNVFQLHHTQARQAEEFGVPLLVYDFTMGKVMPMLFKRAFDVVFSLIGLIAFSPLFLLAALLVKLTSRGPLFFRQTRCTLNGRRFTIYKFRTMVQDAEQRLQELLKYNEMQGPAFKMKKDPRLTPVGGWLRRLSLDELPQLWNILVGNMSLVGPRPPLPHEVERYAWWQRRRLSMRAGLTCLWQISGRSDIVDFDEWMRLDLEYIDNWSLKRDFEILFKTVPAVLFGRGAS